MIEEVKTLADVLNDMQDDCRTIYPSQSSFDGNEGNIYSKTVQCLNDTISDWEILSQRLYFMDPSVISQIRPRSIANESVIEHSFGFVT